MVQLLGVEFLPPTAGQHRRQSRLHSEISRKSSSSTASFFHPLLVFIFLIICILHHRIECLNIDSKFPVHLTPRTPLDQPSFGHSLLMFKSDDVVKFLIGAPKDQLNGNIFNCYWNTSLEITCTPTTLDSSQVHRYNVSMNIGSNLLKHPRENQFLTCPFSQTYYCNNQDLDSYSDPFCYYDRDKVRGKITQVNPTGACYLINSQGSVSQSIFPRPKWDQQHYGDEKRENFLAFAFTGFSSSWSPTGDSLYLSMPGMYEHTGGALMMPFTSTEKEISLSNLPKKNYFGDQLEPVLIDAARSKQIEYNSAGYSMAVGRLFENASATLVLGAPRRNLVGGVDIYDTITHQKIMSLSGNQTGEYFGATVLTVDLNNDGFEDLLVASPTFSTFKKDFADEGRVLVYLTDGQKLRHQTTLFGSGSSNARFGTAIASLGDINSDTYNDVIIGAPYENNNQGAIYVYHGSAHGLKDTFVQRISAESDLKPLHLLGFGYSFASQLDVDNNGFTDLLVGSYLSNSAVMLRTKPILSINSTIEFNNHWIDYDGTTCIVPSRARQEPGLDSLIRRVVCIKITVCLDIDVPIEFPPVSITTMLEADAFKDNEKRAYFVVKNETVSITNWQLPVGKSIKKNCLKQVFYIRDKTEIDNFVDPLVFRLKFALSDKNVRFEEKKWLQTPVINYIRPESLMKNISIKMCNGFAKECESILKLDHQVQLDNSNKSSNSQIQLFQNENKRIKLNISLFNSGDVAISPVLNITINSTDILLKNQDFNCQEPKSTNSLNTSVYIICELENQLEKSQRDSVELVFEPFNQTVVVDINTTLINKLHPASVVHRQLTFNVVKRTDISLKTKEKNVVPFFTSDKYAFFNSTVILMKKYPSYVNRIDVSFIYPTHYQGRQIVDTQQITISKGSSFLSNCSANNFRMRSSSFRRAPSKKPKNLLRIECDKTDEVRCRQETCTVEHISSTANINFDLKNSLLVHVLNISSNLTILYRIRYEAHILDDRNLFDIDESRFDVFGQTDILFEPHVSSKEIQKYPLWPIILAAVIGLLILWCIVCGLIRCGFFRRDRNTTQAKLVDGIPEEEKKILDS